MTFERGGRGSVMLRSVQLSPVGEHVKFRCACEGHETHSGVRVTLASPDKSGRV
jgi:hypothetical protein